LRKLVCLPHVLEVDMNVSWCEGHFCEVLYVSAVATYLHLPLLALTKHPILQSNLLNELTLNFPNLTPYDLISRYLNPA